MGQKLEQLYTDILDYAGMEVTRDGKVIDRLTDDRGPIIVESKQLVLPTETHLKSQNQDQILIFHPLQEHINRGESPVVHKLRHRLNLTLNYATLNLMKGLLGLLNSPALHKKLNPEQRQLLKAVAFTDVTLQAKFAGAASKIFADSVTSSFLNVFLKKAGLFRGKKHARIGVVSFTFKEHLEESKLKPQEKEAIAALFDFVFPGNDDLEAYNAFSDSRDAPWLEALLKSTYNVASRLNDLIKLYREFLDEEENVPFNVKWIEAIDNLEPYLLEIRLIPTQKGNEGTFDAPPPEKPAATTKPAVASTVRTMPAAPAQQQQQPAATGPFVQHPPGHNPVPVVHPQYQQQVPYMHHGQVPPGYGYPAVQPPPVAPGLRTTNTGKLSFDSVEATIPAVAASAFVQTGVTEWAARQQQPYDPRFAQPVYDPRLAPGGWDPRMAQVMYQQPVYDPRFAQPMYGGPAPVMHRGVRPI